MKVAVYHSADRITIEERPRPTPGNGELLVRMVACGVCGSDVMDWYLESRAPLILGHEPVGVVAEIGPGVTDFAVGDRVFVHHHVPCHVCAACRSGHETLCAQFKATRIIPGGFSEYILVPAANVMQDVLKLPADVSFAAGTLIEPFACALRGAKRSRIGPDDAVLVLGAGMMGLLYAFAARWLGARDIAVVDISEHRLKLAERFGFTTLREATAAAWQARFERPPTVICVAVGIVDLMERSLELLDDGGRLHLLAPAPPGRPVRLDAQQVFFRELEVTASYSAGPADTRLALSGIRAGILPVRDLISQCLPLAEAADAFALARAGGENLKVLILGDETVDVFATAGANGNDAP